jgi:hypothetical protein
MVRLINKVGVNNKSNGWKNIVMNAYNGDRMSLNGLREIIIFVAVAVFAISLYAIWSSVIFFPNVYAYNNSVKMTDQKSFVDSSGDLNIVGVVNNVGRMPVGVTVGLNTTSSDGSKAAITNTSIKQPTYGKIIYPFTGAPFKFVITPHHVATSKTFIVNIKQISVPNLHVLSLNYSNMPVGRDGALVGVAKNIGSFDLRDVSVYASAHSRNGAQVDSVKSNVIPVIKPGQQIAFSAKPDPVVKQGIFYYSCAGFDLNAPITTIDIGNGQFIPYDMRALARISDFKYDNATDSFTFGVKYYSTTGGPLSLKIPQTSEKQSVSVMIDGTLYKKASVKMNGKTVFIDFFVPPEDHNIKIKGVIGLERFNTT